jgi:nucleotidyltransferase substrate binding protein (TIGR01987 family)
MTHPPQDIRWHQRLSNYEKAVTQLTKFIDKGNLNELEEQGLIQAFEYTHELAWKTLKDFLSEYNTVKLYGSKDTTREAFKEDLITDGETWMEMVDSRNLSSHTYNEDTTKKISSRIQTKYYKEFTGLLETFLKLKSEGK